MVGRFGRRQSLTLPCLPAASSVFLLDANPIERRGLAAALAVHTSVRRALLSWVLARLPASWLRGSTVGLRSLLHRNGRANQDTWS